MKQRFKVRSRSRGVGAVLGYVFATLLVVAVLGGGVWLFASVAPGAPATPLLLQSRPKMEAGKADQEWFTQHLKERFPSASLEADLIRELWLEGFVPRTNLRAERRSVEFDSLSRELFRMCRLSATISWTADDKGQVTDIDGSYADSCS